MHYVVHTSIDFGLCFLAFTQSGSDNEYDDDVGDDDMYIYNRVPYFNHNMEETNVSIADSNVDKMVVNATTPQPHNPQFLLASGSPFS